MSIGTPSDSPRVRRGAAVVGLSLAVWLAGAPARAQTVAPSASAPSVGQGAPSATEGILGGQVFDRDSGDPVADVTVILTWPQPDDGSEARQAIETTDADGAYRFGSVPAGFYSLTFSKSGYRAAKMTRFEVQAGQVNRADFPIQETPPETAGAVLELEAFVVEAEVVEDILNELELRMDSDQLLNVMSAEDFSKFAASDVADALKRISGVNVVEGQFAIIRGLEDRYSSTMYNSAPVPSPDPDSQSVQLDLFPSDIVSNLVVSKTFAPDLPSNSSGGSIDIITHDYPESFEFKISGGTGWNDNAVPSFISLVRESATGFQDPGLSDTIESDFGALLGGRFELFGREIRFKALGNREIDFETDEGVFEKREPNGVAPPSIDASGACETGNIFVPGVGLVCQDTDRIHFPTDLQNGLLTLSGGRFDTTESTKEQQITGYAGLGFDLDREGEHRVDVSAFYTRKDQETVELRENGFLPEMDFTTLDDILDVRATDFEGFATSSTWLAHSLRDDVLNSSPEEGAPYFASFFESRATDRERDLRVYQANGKHGLHRWVEGLEITWGLNRAATTQSEVFHGLRYFFEPGPAAVTGALPQDPSRFPVPVGENLSGDPLCVSGVPGLAGTRNCFVANNGIFFSANEINEVQDFGRIDADLETEVFKWLDFSLKGGVWYERADREVDATFLVSPNVGGVTNQFAVSAETPEELGKRIFDECDDEQCLDRNEGAFQGLSETPNEARRKIWAWHLGGKATVFERLDLLAGLRREKIEISSLNDPFTPDEPELFGNTRTSPTRYLLFDRLDNHILGEVPLASIPDENAIFNDQVIGLNLEPNTPCPTAADPDRMCLDLSEDQVRGLLNAEISEEFILPAFGVALRPIEGLSLRGAYSRTIARPSFREMGFYVTVEPGTDDQVIGNPQLQLSAVESWDARAEYVWGDLGDLVAVSVFKKSIDDPIESIVLRDQFNVTGANSALFKTFFNNPNPASLEGFEFEARKSLGFLALDFLDRFDIRRPTWLKRFDFLQYLSVGGNYTKINATVKRTEAELIRAGAFFNEQVTSVPRFAELEPERRLFNQPEWIMNADVTFDHPDWGTKITLAFFAISSILESAGSANLSPSGEPVALTLDRYTDAFHQLDLVMSQTRRIEMLRGDITVKFSAKNLTDSTRKLIYDPEQTLHTVAERRFKVGRDYSLSFSYKLTF